MRLGSMGAASWAPALQSSRQVRLEKASSDRYAIWHAAARGCEWHWTPSPGTYFDGAAFGAHLAFALAQEDIAVALRMYRAVTRNIEVVVTPRFVPHRSSAESNYFFFAFTISIINKGTE